MYAQSQTQIWQKPIEATELTAAAFRLVQCAKLKDLAALIGIEKDTLKALIEKPPQYQAFRLPKADGGTRLIEAPPEELKKIQHTLNHYLQAYYHGIHLQGKVNFVGFVRGKIDATFKQLRKRMVVVMAQ